MTAKRLGVALAAPLLMLACNKDRERVGATLAVEKRIVQADGSACFKTCTGSAEIPVVLSDHCPPPDPTTSTDGANVDCGFAGGQDEARVWLSYDVEVAATTALDQPKLRIVTNDAETDPKATFVALPRADKVVQVARFFTPSVEANAAAFRATLPASVEIATASDYSFSIAQPKIGVEVLQTQGGKRCFAACSAAPAVGSTLGQQCAGSPVDCAFAAGKDEIRVSVTSGIEAAATANGEAPKLDLVGNDVAIDPKVDFIPAAQSTGDARYDVVFAARVTAPLTAFDSLAFRATWSDQVSVSTDSSFTVGKATPTLDIDACPKATASSPSQCELPSGAGSINVTVSLPAGFVGKSAALSSTVSGHGVDAAAGQTLTLALDADGQASASAELEVPTGLGHTWTVVATVDSLSANKVMTLRAPADVLLGISAGDQTATPGKIAVPDRAVHEPRLECRTYSVSVSVPDPPNSGQIKLSSVLGTFNGKQGDVLLNLDQTNADAEWVLPTDDDSASVPLTLDVDALRSLHFTVRRQPVLPSGSGGTLAARQNSFDVGPPGTPDDIALRGALSIEPGTVFGSKSALLVRTQVVSATTTKLPCGTPVSSSLIKCDPTATSVQDRGGCFLTPFTVAIAPDGSYSIPIAGGLCFEGELEFTALSRVYTESDPAKCLGELKQSDEVVAVGSTNLTFNATN